MPIRLIVLDIDGVLTQGEASPLDLRLLALLTQMNRAARENLSQPAVTLCTGRPAPYVEVMLQAIDGHLPGIFENGCGLYVPDGYRFLPHPAVSGQTDLPAVRSRLEAELIQTGQAFFQPGKEYSLTLFATDPAETHTLHELVTDALGPMGEAVDLVYSTSCLNVIPRGIDKGKGIEFLTEQAGYAPAEMLGVGDSDVDLPFLAKVGYSAAPANANPRVKEVAQYVSPHPTAAGVRDILRRFGINP